MTREEAIFCVKAYLGETDCIGCKYYGTDTCKSRKALKMLIEALEQEPILDKIRAEIEHVIDNTYDSTDYDKSLYNGAYKDGLYEALDIIDKYKAESEKA